MGFRVWDPMLEVPRNSRSRFQDASGLARDTLRALEGTLAYYGVRRGYFKGTGCSKGTIGFRVWL